MADDNNNENDSGSLNPVETENGGHFVVVDATAVPPPPPQSQSQHQQQVPLGRPSLETSGESSDHTTSSFDNEDDDEDDDDDDDGTLDFASQLRKHRRQVLPGVSPSKKKNDFASTLRQHRDHLVREVWEDSSHITSTNANASNNNNNNGDHFVPVVGEAETATALKDKDDNNGTATKSLLRNGGAVSDGPYETTAVAVDDDNDLLPDIAVDDDDVVVGGGGGTLEATVVPLRATPTNNTTSGENTATPDMLLTVGSSTPDELDSALEATNQLDDDDDDDDQFFDVAMLSINDGDNNNNNDDDARENKNHNVVITANDDLEGNGVVGSVDVTQALLSLDRQQPSAEDDFGFLNGGLRSTNDVINDQGPTETSSDDKLKMTAVPLDDTHQEVKAVSNVQKDVEHNGPFGAFNAAPSISIEPEPSPQDEQEQNGDTEPIGAFDEAPIAKQQEEEEEEEDVRGTSGDDDAADFGAFDEAPVPSPPSPKQPQEASLEFGAIDGDDFGDFGGPEESVTTPNEPENAQAEQIETSNAMPDITSTGVVAMKHADDSFGDADMAIPSSDEGGHLVSTNDEDEGDDFGEFESTEFTYADAGEPGATQTVSDDGFGDFGSPGASTTNHATTTPEPERTLVPQGDSNDDDFGDFGSAELSVAKDTTGQETSVSNDNDFGDFDSADPSETQAASPEDEKSSPADDDDFGDFGSVELSVTKEATPPAPVPAPALDEIADDEDDFGDFGSAEFAGTKEDDIAQAQDASVDDGDDDDFGDFGSAEFVVPDAKSEPTQADEKESGSSEDDDDFGDFGSATPAAAQATATTEEFGNFDDAPTATPTSFVALPPIGDVGDEARDLFARMQEKYPFPDLGQNIDDSDALSSFAGVKVESLLISFQKVQETKQDRQHEMLDAVLKDIPTRTGKAGLIIESDGAGPFAPFVYPPGGLRAPEKEVEMERGRRASSMKLARVPDVLPIQLPTGEEMPLDAASPVAGRKKPTLNGETMVNSDMALPNLGVGNAKAAPGEAGSDKIEKLKKRIPDLSFMLHSALVLPEG